MLLARLILVASAVDAFVLPRHPDLGARAVVLPRVCSSAGSRIRGFVILCPIASLPPLHAGGPCHYHG